jgi:hypothetical protein
VPHANPGRHTHGDEQLSEQTTLPYSSRIPWVSCRKRNGQAIPQDRVDEHLGCGSALSHGIRQVHNTKLRILVEERAVPVTALISADDLARIAELERERESRFAVIERSRAAFSDVSADEIEAKTDRIIAGLRAQDRALADDEAAIG